MSLKESLVAPLGCERFNQSIVNRLFNGNHTINIISITLSYSIHISDITSYIPCTASTLPSTPSIVSIIHGITSDIGLN